MPNHPLGPAAAAASIAAGAALVLSLVVAYAPSAPPDEIRLVAPPPLTATPFGTAEAIVFVAMSLPW